jgi:hypothetical protein
MGKKKSSPADVTVTEVQGNDFPQPPPIPPSPTFDTGTPRGSGEYNRKSLKLTYTNFDDDTRYNAVRIPDDTRSYSH